MTETVTRPPGDDSATAPLGRRPSPGPRLTHEPDGLRREPLGERLRWALPWLAMLLTAEAIAPFRDQWAVQVALLGWLLFAPGRLFLAVIRFRPMQVRRFPVFALAMSLLLIMVTGLTVDGIGIVSGDSHPLRTGPLWVGIVVVYLLLVGAAMASPRIVRPAPTLPPRVGDYCSLALPLLAAVGAERLNNGHGSVVAVIAMAVLAMVWVARPFLRHFDWRSASITIYSVSLAGMWSFSLRGDSVYGYDIISEYFAGRRTASSGVWHLQHVNDAYGSLLSVTILPAVLHSVTGTAVLVVFKVVFPALFAFVPVAVLRIAGQLVRLRWAYVSVGLIIGQAFFFDSMPAVSRQEIAFIFFVCLLAALMETRERLSVTLAVLCSIGLILSHYSSTYMAVALTGAAFVFGLVGLALRRDVPLLRISVAFATLLGGSLLWYRGLTDSASNVGNVLTSFRHNGFNLLPNRTGNLVSTLVLGNVTQPLSPAQYASEIATRYGQIYPFVRPLAQAHQYSLHVAPTVAGEGSIARWAGLAVSIVSQLANLLAAIGTFLLAFGRNRNRVERTVGLVSLGVLFFLVLVRVSGTVSVSYNQERAQIQAFFLLAPVVMWVLSRLHDGMIGRARSRRSRRRKSRPRAPALAIVALLATGVLVTNATGLLRGSPTRDGTANLSATGEDDLRFVQTRADIEGARWLHLASRSRGITYADTYGQLRLLGVSGTLEGILADVTPRTLNRQAWIYADSANTQQQQARATFDGRAVSYRFPKAFIAKFYDRVFTNGTAEVYHQ